MERPKQNDLDFLREKASSLPKLPGVYIMEDRYGEVIYVGKSRSLKDRVSQYFHGTHDIKTSKMASSVNNFRFIVCDSEMDALILENDLIKKHTPRYNILLKDSKAYPYIKVTKEEYPRVVMARKKSDDGMFFGPYSGTSVVYGIITTLERTFGIPSCKRKFPKDIGRTRPCVNRQIGRCCGVCAGDIDKEEYASIIDCAVNILKGNTREASRKLEARMFEAAEKEKFEEAARCRDSLAALEKLSKKRKVTDLPLGSEYDVIALTSVDANRCAAVFYVRDGIISDSEQFIFGADEIVGYITKNEIDGVELEGCEAELGDCPLTSFIANLYGGREYIPSEILLSFEMPKAEKVLIEEYLSKKAGKKVTVKTPVRGEMRRLCVMAENDARRHAESRKVRTDASEKILASLAMALSLEVVPSRIECYDISNLGDEFITAGMIVAENGALLKSDYRYFRIKSTDISDDYASMREAVLRRLSHLGDTEGAFSKVPDLILLDGGMSHVKVVKECIASFDCDIPVFGMVKDEHHKTRSLVSESEEISIARDMLLFQFIYKLQEEVHRFTIGKMKAAKLKSLKTSELEKIHGIGKIKAKSLLLGFGCIDAVAAADKNALMAIEKISESDAENIISYFKNKR